MKKFLLITLLILALVGTVDAGYLLVQTLRGEAVVCPNVPIGRFNLNQCDIVLGSAYAKIFGLPNALYGLVAYLFFALLIMYELNERKMTGAIKLLSYLSGLGILVFAYFIYLQFFVIKAICLYCLASALMMALIFALSIAYNVGYSLREGT